MIKIKFNHNKAQKKLKLVSKKLQIAQIRSVNGGVAKIRTLIRKQIAQKFKVKYSQTKIAIFKVSAISNTAVLRRFSGAIFLGSGIKAVGKLKSVAKTFNRGKKAWVYKKNRVIMQREGNSRLPIQRPIKGTFTINQFYRTIGAGMRTSKEVQREYARRTKNIFR